MSGHSKWATTKHQKAAADSKRANLFTKLSKNITLAARKGGDPEMNFSLRLTIEKAKEANMPKDNIERAVKRGTGELEGAAYEEAIYEGYGPGGVPLLIEAVTDNKNRTTPEIKSILTKAGGSLGAQNSVQWMFSRKGIVRLNADKILDKDSLLLELLEMGADDVVEEDGGLTAYVAFENFEKLKKNLEQKNISPDYAEMEWVAKDRQTVDAETEEKVSTLVEQLESHEDVNGVFTTLV